MHDTTHTTIATQVMKKLDFFTSDNLFVNKIKPFCKFMYKNKESGPVLVRVIGMSPIAAFPAGAGAFWLDFRVMSSKELRSNQQIK